jgi:hypothetical protein
MSEPEIQMDAVLAGRRGRLMTCLADREQAIEVLKDAFVQGRLTQDEFEARVGQALTSLTYAELAALTADIPAWLTGAPVVRGPQPPRRPARPRARVSMNTAVTGGAFVAIATNVAMLGALAAGSGVAVIVVAVFFVVAAAVAVGAMIVAR